METKSVELPNGTGSDGAGGAPPREATTSPAATPAPTAVTPETLARVRERDPRAMATFFEFYFDRVFALAYRLLGNRDAAEDATQEVFQKVHRAVHQLDPSRDPTPWLLAITHNACRDVWRSRAYKLAMKSRSLEDTEGLAASLPDPGESPEDAAIRRQRAGLVQQAILELPEDLRAIVVLHDYQGLGHEEIAGIVGITHVAVRKRYSRALARMAKVLEGVL